MKKMQNLVIFGQKILIFTGESKSFGTHIKGKPPTHLVRIVFWSGMGRNRQKKCQHLAQIDQKCIFWTKFVRFWPKILTFTGVSKSFATTTKAPCLHYFLVVRGTKRGGNVPIWPIMTKNAYFGHILAVCGPNILIFRGVSKSFGTNITENHLDNLSALFFGQALDQMGQKCRYLAQNASFGPNLAVFGPQIHFFARSWLDSPSVRSNNSHC